MKLSRLSFVLILLALTWSLSAASLLANESPNREPKSKMTSIPSANKQQSEADKKATPTEHPQNTTAPEPIPVVKELTPAVKENGSKKQADYLCAIKTWLVRRQPGSIPDYLLVFITGAAVLVALGTLRAINRQVSANQTSAEAALLATNTAERSLQAGIEKTNKQLRAYIGIERVYVKDLGSAPLPYIVEATIKNTGQSLAKDVRVWLTGIYVTDERMAATLYGGTAGRIVLMPHGAWTYHEVTTIERGKNDWEQMVRGMGLIVVSGKIEYRDVFGEDHWTTFRYITYKRETDGWSVKPCEEGNDAN